MRDTRLVFVEGIMGSGKSTTASRLAEELRRHGVAARFLPEGPTRAAPRHPLRVMNLLPHPMAPWRDLTSDAYVALSLHKWRDFVHAALDSDEIVVSDGLLFHGNMTDLMLMNAPRAMLRDYVAALLATVAPLRPSVIYLRRADMAEALRLAVAERGLDWQAYQLNWKLASPYAVERRLHGFEGFVELYQAYETLCDEQFAELSVPKLVIHVEGDWRRHLGDVLRFMELEEG